MTYLVIDGSKSGLDTRRSLITSPDDTLLFADNVHITRGGEIEKRKQFSLLGAIPAGSVGLVPEGDKCVVYSLIDAPEGVPSDIKWVRIRNPIPDRLYANLSATANQSLGAVTGRFIDGYTVVAGHKIMLLGQTNAAENGLYVAASDGSLSRDSAMNADEDLIQHMTVHIIDGTVRRGQKYTLTTEGPYTIGTTNLTWAYTSVWPDASNYNPGVGVSLVRVRDSTRWDRKAYAAIEQSDGKIIHVYDGTLVTDWQFDDGPGATVEILKDKIYSALNADLFASALNVPTYWGPDEVDQGVVGSFVIDTSNYSTRSEDIFSLSLYHNYLAVFSRRNVQIWEMDPDPQKNILRQVINTTGCIAARSVQGYGNDVLFLSDSGIRSLNPRTNIDIIAASDAGAPIDDYIAPMIETYRATMDAKACSAVDPVDGRYLLAIHDTIYVYSFFQASGVKAWTTYSPGFVVDEMASTDTKLFLRSGNNLYRYGPGYDTCLARVIMPWLDTKKPATVKNWTGIDVGCEGTWTVKVGTDIHAPNLRETVGTVSGITYGAIHYGVQMQGTHMSVLCETSAASAARLYNLAVHYQDGESR